MLLWLSFAVICAGVLAALLSPLLRPVAQAEPQGSADREVYRDQLAEIAADRARGLLGEAEAEAAEREIARRLLARDAGNTPPPAEKTGHLAASNPLLVVAIALVPAAALVVYSINGAPTLPARPFAARSAPSQITDLIAKVEARLAAHPEDGQGWDVIAPVYHRQERFAEAAAAYSNAIRILGPNARRLAGFAESTIIVANGIVSEPARSAYEQLLKIEPDRAEARFWLAMAKEQDGKLDAAAADYAEMLARAPADAPWRDAVAERLKALDGKRGAPSPAAQAPSASKEAAIRQLPPAEQMQAIEGMVAGLAQRLQTNGADLEGWLKLVRAYKVLGRHDAAAAALAKARTAMKNNSSGLSELDALAKSLGIGS